MEASWKTLSNAFGSWNAVIAGFDSFGIRNSQVTLIAPTGTISFMMDCETTGIEPVLALRMKKALAGGGTLDLDVMESVEEGLDALGVTTVKEAVLSHIRTFGSVEGCNYLTEDLLPPFDTSFGTPSGRCISWDGHLKMMAAAQPFLSGAISKTINMPNRSTVEDVEECYTKAWHLGLKNVAIYRDGCKRTQPLTSVTPSKKDKEAMTSKRRRLPDTRRSTTHKFEVAGHEGYLTVGFFEDDTIGEIFLKMSKEGSAVSGLVDAWATSVSLALQYGCPISKIIEKFMHWRFEPHGPTSNPDISIATSIVDYVARYLDNLLKTAEPIQIPAVWITPPTGNPDGIISVTGDPGPIIDTTTGTVPIQLTISTTGTSTLPDNDAPFCRQCGVQMVSIGSCHTCINCGSDSGCG